MLEKQLQALKDAGRERDIDLITLNTVLQCNQDVINVSRSYATLHKHTVYINAWLVTAAAVNVW